MPTTINPSGQTITQYNVQSGGASNLLNNIAPSATSGIPLVSQGVAAQPIFSTVGVAGGGTGVTSFTPYAVITGGTTATGPLQNVSGVGSIGQILTSNGASTLPTWQTPSGGFSPSTRMTLQDDFTSVSFYSPTQAMYSELTWTYSGVEQAISATDAGHPGEIRNVSSSGPISISTIQQSVILGAGVVTLNWIAKVDVVSSAGNPYEWSIGFNELRFYTLYTVNSGNWTLKSTNGAPTTVNTSTALTTGWHNYQIVINAAATSVTFSIDGVAVGSAITTNIPTSAQKMTITLDSTGGSFSGGQYFIDAFYLTYDFTTPR